MDKKGDGEMTSRHEYKTNLKRLDKDIRVCFLYLEGLIEDRFKTALATQHPPPAPQGGLSKIESTLDSLQKQIDGLRPKVEAGYTLAQGHEETEKYLMELAKKVELVLDQYQTHFKELYKSGYYKEGARRKIRAEGLLENLKERPR